MRKIPSSEITPKELYLSRRQFMRGLGTVAGSALALSACSASVADTGIRPPAESGATAVPGSTAGASSPAPDASPSPELVLTPPAIVIPKGEPGKDELGDGYTSFEAITTYNNYFEFSEAKEAPAQLARDFQTRPWTVQVGGLVNKPRTFDIEELMRMFPSEERVYRLRCVEAWSMVIPWLGFPIARLLREVEPLSSARYVRFEALHDVERMPGQRKPWYQWPYVEGLRIDEAMNDLAILSTGLYGEHLLPQNGAPLRLVAPWKYGFKSIKAIVKIDLVEEQPTSLWMAASPYEYGFYANVNPMVDHPRWSQFTERRIGELRRRETLMFNGYADQVSYLYKDMNLRKNF
jgi:sulfoxide reductase catalytic subunit YedY